MASGAGGTYVTGTGTLTFQAWAANSNGLFDTTGFTNGLQTTNPASGTGTTFDTGPDATGNFSRLFALYSLTSETNITLSAGGNLNFSVHELVVPGSPVPEPSSVLLLGFGLVGLACLATRRRKQQA